MARTFRLALPLLVLAFVIGSCEEPRSQIVNHPVSIRGWIADVERTIPPGVSPNVIIQGNTLEDYIQQSNVYLKGGKLITGGLMNGSFIMMDVPPGDATIVFQAPGIYQSPMTIHGIPPAADVVLSGVDITKHGTKLDDPSKALVRIAAKIDKMREIPSTTTINGVKIRTVEVPLVKMGDRMNYIERGAFPYEPGYKNPNIKSESKKQKAE